MGDNKEKLENTEHQNFLSQGTIENNTHSEISQEHTKDSEASSQLDSKEVDRRDEIDDKSNQIFNSKAEETLNAMDSKDITLSKKENISTQTINSDHMDSNNTQVPSNIEKTLNSDDFTHDDKSDDTTLDNTMFSGNEKYKTSRNQNIKKDFVNLNDLDRNSTPMNKTSKSPLYLSLLSIVIAAASVGGNFIYFQKQTEINKAAILANIENNQTQLQQEIALLQNQFVQQQDKKESEINKITLLNTQMNQSLDLFSESQQKALKTFSLEQETAQSRLAALEQKVNRLATQDNSDWLISQADFYVKMAARRLWAEKDILTAMTLLKTADNSLAQMNDSSLVPIREAISSDIATLAAINPPDVDGIVSKLSALTRSVDKLVLKPEFRRPTTSEAQMSEISANVGDWRQNFLASLQDFSQDFIKIRRVDSQGNVILSPEQAIYLKENIRARLFLATQSVSRQQASVYKETIEDIILNVTDFFDSEDPLTQHFLMELNSLKAQQLTLSLPNSFVSREPLERLVNERVLKWVLPKEDNRPIIGSSSDSDSAETSKTDVNRNSDTDTITRDSLAEKMYQDDTKTPLDTSNNNL
ncbi:uroporphyrinogen-III C-methyltransferase [Thorsellia kenyensis]|uniref:Uroporphyrinogen-III C-methyltransferase n=1 Tax=Thorsellia kenyensis TaxID=1549888 RepID=A0ABV6C7C2_9GAMM